jgi:hypothetical protein
MIERVLGGKSFCLWVLVCAVAMGGVAPAAAVAGQSGIAPQAAKKKKKRCKKPKVRQKGKCIRKQKPKPNPNPTPNPDPAPAPNPPPGPDPLSDADGDALPYQPRPYLRRRPSRWRLR